MATPAHPTSIRLDRDLRKRLRYQAEKEGRTMAQHIVHILKTATAFVKVPKRFGKVERVYLSEGEGEK